jgi:CHAD domain-containing protein
LHDYVKNPSDENIHHIRTSIRRLEASYLSSIKKLRKKKKLKKYVNKSKKLFKINSEVRDFDIISEKLTKEGNLPLQQYEQITTSIRNNRSKNLEKAKTVALELNKMDIPHFYTSLHDNDSHYAYQRHYNKVIGRYNKIVYEFIDRIEKNIPIVVNNSEKLKELHNLRKDSKKLRYLLELAINKHQNKESEEINDENNKNKNIFISLIDQLEEVQDMLGEIHDYDITIDYMKQQNQSDRIIQDVITNLYKLRKEKYEHFVKYSNSEMYLKLDNSFINLKAIL